MKKEIKLEIEDKFEEMADDIKNDELLSVIGGFVKILVCLCGKNNIDLQIDIYGYDKNNTTINYDCCYDENDE